MDNSGMKKYQNNGHVVVSAPSTSPHYMQQSQQLAQQPGASGMPSVATSNNAHVNPTVVTPVPASAVTSAASVAAAAAHAVASAATPLAASNMGGGGGPPVVSAHANTNDNLAKAAQQPPDATPTASINPEAVADVSGHHHPAGNAAAGAGGQPPSNHQYSSHPQHRGHNQREDNYNTGFSYNPRASMESIQSGKDMQK